VGDDRDGARGGEHEPDREQADRADVLAQLAQPGEERRRVEQRGQEDEQHEIRLELDVRDARDQPEPEASEHEEDRIRHVEHARRSDENRDGEQQAGEHQLRVRARCGHRWSVLARLG
jgi:hypothetical protein